jgi:hypothetical protein
MATTLNIKTISTLKQYSSFIEEKLQSSTDYILWFRGTGKSSYTLSPSIHRHPKITQDEKIIEMETQIIDRFNQRSVPFLSRPLDKTNDWETLFFMQHYRIPTRLLDWTENPFIALYFALTSAKYEIEAKKKVYKDDVAVWVLDPVAWNRESLKDYTYNQGILSVQEHFLESYKPRIKFDGMREKPVAIFGTHNSPRIVAQRGVFTVFGKKVQPMEKTYVDEKYKQDCLMKIVFPSNKISNLLQSLTSLGITDSVVYPDLEGLGKEVMRFFKFDI